MQSSEKPPIVTTETESPSAPALKQWLEDAPTSYVETIETAIYTLESEKNALVLKTPEGHLWSFPYGSVQVFVLLTGETDEDMLKVWAEVMAMPSDLTRAAALQRRVLSLNWTDTFEAGFAVYQDRLVVLAHRLVEDLSAAEISRAITLVATLADDYDDILIAEYGDA